MIGKAGSLGNIIGMKRVGEFKYRIWQSCVYPKFGHLENMLMGVIAKPLVEELSIKAAAYAHDVW